MFVALSGTPGTGKSTISALLQIEGYDTINLNEIAIDQGFITGTDSERNSKIIDINRSNDYINDHYKTENVLFIDGHASHLLNTVEKVIILRCHPSELKRRLGKKKWTEKKIKENVEAETIDVILCESIEHHNEENIFEINTTNKEIKFVLSSIIEIIKSNFKPIKKYKLGKIDWSEEILNDF